MSRKSATKPYWELNTDELRDATQEFDVEFVADSAKPLTPQMQARWERAQRKPAKGANGAVQETIAVCMDKALLDRCTALAKSKRITRDALIARGLKALLAAEGEI